MHKKQAFMHDMTREKQERQQAILKAKEDQKIKEAQNRKKFQD